MNMYRFFFSFFIYVLWLKIQISREEGWVLIKRYYPRHIYVSVPSESLNFNVQWYALLLCSLNWVERWLYILLILVELLDMHYRWRSNYQKGRVDVPLTGLTPKSFCACSKSGRTWISNVMRRGLFIFNELR